MGFARALPLGKIRPTGWLFDQLRLQANGLGGHLHEFWPDIKDSQWRGGSGEGWERVPYWLDGFLPLAYLLDDSDLIQVASEWIDVILGQQSEDGWFGPVVANESHGAKSNDPWPHFILFKVFIQWFELTGDPRIIPAMLRASKRIHEVMQVTPLWEWAKMRWMELNLSVSWLHEQTGEGWILELMDLARDQGYNWARHFEEFEFEERAEKWTFEGHVVNHAMALKEPIFRQSDPWLQFEMLDRYHGQANGMFSGDECLAGRSPSQGTELCAVVEAMFSLELLYAEYGEPPFMDRLERITFNALPATFTKDMWAHQYDQQVNQVLCVDSGDRENCIFTTNGPKSNLFGLEPNFGCCTANFHQGWPKFVSHLWLQTTSGAFIPSSYAPCHVSTDDVEFEVVTDYPRGSSVKINVLRGRASFQLPIPYWTSAATLNGVKAIGESIQAAELNEGESVELDFPMNVRWEMRNGGFASVYVGPLLYGLKIEEQVTMLGDEPYADREVRPGSDWNYAIDLESLVYDPSTGEVRGVGVKIPEWGIEKDAAATLEAARYVSEDERESLILVPYGDTLLRIAEFPVLV